MALEAIYRKPGDTIRHTLAAAQKGGDIVQTAGFAAVVQGVGDYANGDVVEVAIRGEFEIASASATTFSAGDRVMWDDSESAAVTVASGNGDFNLGIASRAKTSGQTTVWVLLNQTPVVVDT